MKSIPLAVVIVLMLATATLSQGRGVGVQTAAPTKRIALIIGNSAYHDSPLRNTLNDAEDIANALRNLGFEVTHKKNFKLGEMKSAVREFSEKLHGGSVGLFYFAGHGVQVNGENYLIPVDAEISSEWQIEAESLGLDVILSAMVEGGSETNIVILDACRSVPIARRFRSTERGLAQVTAGKGTLVAYATAPGSVAGDGNERNGVYTQELLKNIRTPGINIEELLRRVRVGVYERTGGQQVPWETSSLFREFYFVEGSAKVIPAPENTVLPSDNGTSPKMPPGGAGRADATLTTSLDGIEFSLGGCVYSKADATAVCALEINNKGRKRDVLVQGYDKELPGTVLTDAYGNQYTPAEVRYGKQYSQSYVFFTLESGVPYRVQLTFRVGLGFGSSPTFKSLTVDWAIGEVGASKLDGHQIKFESGPVVLKQEAAAPQVSHEPEVKQQTLPLTLNAVPGGPNNLASTYSYSINGGAAKLVLRAEAVKTNDDQSLAQEVTRITHDLSAQGSHVWDNNWYYWRLGQGEYFLVAWGTEAELGWILVEKYDNAWWYKTNSGKWQHIRAGEPRQETWTIGGTKVTISIEIPRQENGWTASDVKYKFSS
jgi:hypothetical protein